MSPVVRNHVIVVAAVIAVVVVTIILGQSENVGWIAAIALVAGHVVIIATAIWAYGARKRHRNQDAA